MGTFIIYLLKSAIYLAVFYLFNRLLLSKETFHKFNRFLWLLIIPISLLLPIVDYSFNNILGNSYEIPTAIESEEIGAAHTTSPIVADNSISISIQNSLTALLIIYMVGVGITFIFKLVAYIKLNILLSQLKGDSEFVEKFEQCKNKVGCKNVVLKVHNMKIVPFSWMRTVVVSREDLRENGEELLIHELSHIKEGHSWDVLLCDLFIVFQWFNPASWLLKRSLTQLHEYSVDENVINIGIDAKSYQLLLIKKAAGLRFYSMANSFNHSKLKNRITMMLKQKSNRWAYAKCLYALPLAFLAMSAFCAPEVSAKISEISSVKISKNLSYLGQDTLTLDNLYITSYADKEAKSNKKLDEPIFIIDGVIVEKKIAMNISAKYIQSKTVLKGDKAVALYGDKAKYGISIITLIEGKTIRDILELSSEMTKNNPQEKVQYAKIEVKPTFNGGNPSEFAKWVATRLVYPAEAKAKKEQGRVMLQFTIDVDGSVKNVKVLRGINKLLDNEALKVVKSSPKWKPGEMEGKAVPVIMNFPITFMIK